MTAPARPTRRAVLAAGLQGLLLAGAGGEALAQAPAAPRPEASPPEGPLPVAVRARPIPAFQPSDPQRRRFGQLEFRGGLQLSVGSERFGGFSGLWRGGQGGSQLVAVSDRGDWFTATIERRGPSLSGLSEAALSPMLNAAGRPLARSRAYDTEALCIADGVAYVGVERTHEILRFDWARRGVAARGQSLPLPPEVKRMPRNRGFEAIGVAPPASPVAGAIVALAERSGREDEPTLGVIVEGARTSLFGYRLKDQYDVTDLAFLPDGDMLVLERWYRPWRGVGMRLRRIAGAALRPGAVLDGPVLMEADLAQEIDNMEGLSIHREGPKTIVTMISDDNFSMIQRTILLEFELMPG